MNLEPSTPSSCGAWKTTKVVGRERTNIAPITGNTYVIRREYIDVSCDVTNVLVLIASLEPPMAVSWLLRIEVVMQTQC